MTSKRKAVKTQSRYVFYYEFARLYSCREPCKHPLIKKTFFKYVVCCRLQGNTDSRAGTTSWRMEILYFSNSTHPTLRRRNHEQDLRDLSTQFSQSDPKRAILSAAFHIPFAGFGCLPMNWLLPPHHNLF